MRLACSRFHGHRVKVVEAGTGVSNAEKEVQPRAQAEGVRLAKERDVAVA
jgi:hypothetical protein